MKNTITIILIILLMYGLHSCNYVDSKINESNIMEKEHREHDSPLS